MNREQAESSIGGRVVVLALDGHRFTGQLIETRTDSHGRQLAVLRLDSGWVTSYPLDMVEPLASNPEL